MIIKKPDEQAYLKALVYGPHGQGKTHLLGTAQLDARTRPMLLIDWEGNTETLAGLDIDVAVCRTWQDMNEVYAMLTQTNHGYKSVGIDSLTELNLYALITEMNRQVALGGKGRDTQPDAAQIQDYGVTLVQMRRLLRNMRDLPMHVIFTALDDSDVTPREGTVKLPMMVGKMRQEVGALMSVVGYLAIEESDGKINRTLLLHSIPKYRVKVRTGWGMEIPETLDNPTVGKILNTVLPHTKENTNA